MKRNAALLIHYYFPPIHSIGCMRNVAFTHEWYSHVDYLKVLTTTNRNILPSDASHSVDHYDIEELRTNDYRTQRAKNNPTTMHYDESAKSGYLRRLAVKTIHTYPVNLWMGEGGRDYIRHGVEAGSKYLEEHPDAYIYSSFRPYSDHAIAAKLKAKYPRTTWIADFRDADIDPLYKLYLHRGWQERFNKNILKLADKVVTVSDGVSAILSKYHHNVVTINNGVKVRPPVPHYQKYTIAYTGSLYGDHRDPLPLLQAIKELIDNQDITSDQLQLIYAGKDGVQYQTLTTEQGLGDLLDNRGMVSSGEALEIQSKAHCNLLLTSAIAGYTGILTGKLYEYIGAGNQILTLVNGIRDSEIDRMVDDYSLGHVHYTSEDSVSQLATAIKSNIKRWTDNQEVKGINIDSIKNTLSWTSQFQKLITN